MVKYYIKLIKQTKSKTIHHLKRFLLKNFTKQMWWSEYFFEILTKFSIKRFYSSISINLVHCPVKLIAIYGYVLA